MTAKKIAELEQALTVKMQAFLVEEDTSEFYKGSSTDTLMAKAALTVLMAIDDAQTSLWESGYMKEDE